MTPPFHNEDMVRGLAQEALGWAATGILGSLQQYACVQHGNYDSFDQLISRFAAMSFNATTADIVDTPAVRETFDARRQDGGFVFDQPTLIDVFRVA